MVAWKMSTFSNVWHRTVVHSYSKKMLESGDNHIKKISWNENNSNVVEPEQSPVASLKS